MTLEPLAKNTTSGEKKQELPAAKQNDERAISYGRLRHTHILANGMCDIGNVFGGENPIGILFWRVVL